MASSGSYDGMFIGDGEQNVVNWKLGTKIASGRHGTVSHMKNLKDQQLRKYVVKQSIISDDINRASLESIDIEIRALKHVDHYRIIKYFGYSRTERVFSLFIEFMERGSLAKYINSQLHGRLTEEKAAMFTYQILEGLVFLHELKIIHRDIKGSNILMQDENNIKISDFGVAKILNTLSQANTQGKGTISWMAPEMFKEGTHKKSVDIWSLGCTVYQMVTGKIPFEGLSIFQISQRVSKNEHELPMLEKCSDILKDFLSQVCRKEPSERPSAEDLLKHEFVKGFSEIKRENSQSFDDKDGVDNLEMGVNDLADSATVSKEELWIKQNYSKLLKEMKVEDFTPDLVEKGVIDWDDEEEIDNKDSRCNRVKCLIRKLLQSRKEEALKIFLALLESKYPTFAEKCSSF
ncbi:uncharacterized protein LOC131943281 [Physella acuta]|uniref:uncharacterized protein LOC131943281 n=1 Tax=Physella acuta TaxID=109671 RepID=UPI0027DC7C6E|nr:uncharacterized protein LOC131943281 [Physella acuta]